MAKFKVIVSESKGTSKMIELEDAQAASLIGRRIHEVIDGSIVNLPGQKMQITGGSDKDGFPMRPDVHGGVRRKIILSGGIGFNPKDSGQRKRKTVRGNVITEDIVQINMKIVQENKTDKTKRK